MRHLSDLPVNTRILNWRESSSMSIDWQSIDMELTWRGLTWATCFPDAAKRATALEEPIIPHAYVCTAHFSSMIGSPVAKCLFVNLPFVGWSVKWGWPPSSTWSQSVPGRPIGTIFSWRLPSITGMGIGRSDEQPRKPDTSIRDTKWKTRRNYLRLLKAAKTCSLAPLPWHGLGKL